MIKLVYPKFWSKNGHISILLKPFSWIYILLGNLRKYCAKPIAFDAKTICIGNMSVGGTGKTQLVLWLANKFNNKKLNFLIVTKGYGGTLKGAKIVGNLDSPSEVGDESKLLSEFACVIASKNIRDAIPLIKQKKPDIIIFDDGFQNPHFIKDLNILVLDSSRGVGNGLIFPAGPLRESTDSAISKSDIIAMIGNNPCQDFSLINKIIASKKPFFKASIKLTSKLDKSKRYLAFSAIGNPDRFYDLLKDNGFKIAEEKSFPDHHNYTKDEIANLKQIAKDKDFSLITTKKDYVKIEESNQIICADVLLDFDDEETITKLIYEKS